MTTLLLETAVYAALFLALLVRLLLKHRNRKYPRKDRRDLEKIGPYIR
jgi:hypothetical protein